MELNALVISDLQIPAEHIDALRFVTHVDRVWFPPESVDGILTMQKRVVINVGDEFDQHTLGKYPPNPDGRSGGDELKEAKHRIRDWYAAFPKVFVCASNHTYRAWKKAFINGIPSQFMKSIGEVYDAPPGWQWKDRWISGDILFEHGENVSGPTAALNAAIQNQMCTVIGHQHSHAGVIWRAAEVGSIFGMNVGCLIDVKQYNFDYGKNYRIKPSLGCGVIKNGIPYFIPMIVDHQSRWVGRI